MARIPSPDQKTICELRLKLVNIPQQEESNGRKQGADQGWEVVDAPYPQIHFDCEDETSFLQAHAPFVASSATQELTGGGRGRTAGGAGGRKDQREEDTRKRALWEERLRSALQKLLGLLQALASRDGRQTLLESALIPLHSWLPQIFPPKRAPVVVEPPPLAWHVTQQRLAAADAADRVHVFDVGAGAPKQGEPPVACPPPLRPSHTLVHELQAEVSALAWRPNAGGMLAVGCAGGICLWTVGGSPAAGIAPSRSGGNGGWATFLQSGFGRVTALSWSPCGRLLASSSADAQGFIVWDVALGAPTYLRAGFFPVSLLSWSPDGCFLLTGSSDGYFHIWDTDRWGNTRWKLEAEERLLGMAWAADGRSALLAFSGARLGALYFTQPPPARDAQLLPLPLPELQSGAGATITAFAWDSRGQRLAVAVGGDHPAAGLVAFYATPPQPLTSAQLIGFARSPNATPSPHFQRLGRDESDAEANTPMALSFWSPLSSRHGPVLAVRQGDGLITFLPSYL